MAQSPEAKAAQIAGLKPWKAGESPNPGGKPVGARNRLQGNFLNTLAADFDVNGKAAIVSAREKDPMGYVKAIVALMPKEVELKRPIEEMADDELLSALSALRSFLAAKDAEQRDGDSPASTTAH